MTFNTVTARVLSPKQSPTSEDEIASTGALTGRSNDTNTSKLDFKKAVHINLTSLKFVSILGVDLNRGF